MNRTSAARALDSEARQLQSSVQSFVRRFGLLVTRQTPCGQPISTSQAHALMILLERERLGITTSHTDLAGLLALDKSNVTRLCAGLQAQEQVTQEVRPDDARGRHLKLTARGKRVAANVQAASLDRFQRVVNVIPTAKRKAVLESLQLLTAAVSTLDQDLA